MIYAYKREIEQFPWRYAVYVNGRLVELTFTEWGAKRFIRRYKETEDDITYVR